MIDSFRLNPVEYLSVTACRRNLAGDVGSVLRVHGFLEQWGLINYHLDGDKHSHMMGPPSTAHFNVHVSKHSCAYTCCPSYLLLLQVDTPMGLQGLPRNPGQTSATDQLIQMGTKSADKDKDLTVNLGYIYSGTSCRQLVYTSIHPYIHTYIYT